MAIITINGVGFDPSEMSITTSSVSASTAGRDNTGYMYPDKICDKFKISLSWWAPTPELTAQILTAVKPSSFWVTFTNPETNSPVARQFYVGDRSAPVKFWNINKKRYSKVSFNIIER